MAALSALLASCMGSVEGDEDDHEIQGATACEPGAPPRTPDDNWDGMKVYGRNMIFDHVSVGGGLMKTCSFDPTKTSTTSLALA